MLKVYDITWCLKYYSDFQNFQIIFRWNQAKKHTFNIDLITLHHIIIIIIYYITINWYLCDLFFLFLNTILSILFVIDWSSHMRWCVLWYYYMIIITWHNKQHTYTPALSKSRYLLMSTINMSPEDNNHTY